MIYTTRKINRDELDRLALRGPDDETSGWAVVCINCDDETVVGWYADRYAARQDAADRNEDGTMKTKWQVGDVYYQAQIFRHGRGLDYDNTQCETLGEAEADLQTSLGMMSKREREQSEVESHVRKFRVVAVEADGSIGAAETC